MADVESEARNTSSLDSPHTASTVDSSVVSSPITGPSAPASVMDVDSNASESESGSRDIKSPASPYVTDTMRHEQEKLEKREEKERQKELTKTENDFTDAVKAQRMKRLHFLLSKSSAYVNILADKLKKQQDEARQKAAKVDEKKRKQAEGTGDHEKVAKVQEGSKRETRHSTRQAATEDKARDASDTTTKASNEKASKSTAAAKKRKTDADSYQISDYVTEESLKTMSTNDESVGVTASAKPTPSARQPSLVTGGVLRDYQLAGVEWLISLWENGLNGILADEMGLGKTLQTISFIAHLKEMDVTGPFLIAAPLSTLANWVTEFHRFTPKIPVILYHGSKEERLHMINRKLQKRNETKWDFPIVVTSYEIVMNDRKYLQRFRWKYIVVDEGHRIKNLQCRLIRELKSYSSANRLLLTGTPLQNNLAELWSLLNFLLPDIFDDLDMFQSWFDFSDINQRSGQERIMKEEEEDNIVSSLHTILKPFLLRRLKVDVEHSLPKKKEYLLYAPLTKAQKDLYDAILNRDIRSFLIHKRGAGNAIVDNGQTKEPSDAEATEGEASNVVSEQEDYTSTDDKENDDPTSNNASKNPTARRSTRSTGRTKAEQKFYNETMSDSAYLKKLEESRDKAEGEEASAKQSPKENDKDKKAAKFVNGLSLQNLFMQLRKACNHPYLFEWPIDPKTGDYDVGPGLVNSSGKLMLLDRLLPALFERGHKTLIFSQMTKTLDILEEWVTQIKGWKCCRLDGSVNQNDRREQITQFNDPKSDVMLFLLSTRAGGLGINLTAADTVVLFDSDWNPQMDLQAQDRVHRIGQKKPVLIYRLVTANTVESKMLERATAKRRLEKLVIHKGKFKLPVNAGAPKDKEEESTLVELADILASQDGEKVQLISEGDKAISDQDLEKILDRSRAVFESTSESASGGFKEIDVDSMRDTKSDAFATRL